MLSQARYSAKSTDRAFKFLERNTSFIRSLVANCQHDLERVTTIIEPILNAPKRCEQTPFYIQAVTTGKSTFLVTNLTHEEAVHIVDNAEKWFIGRSRYSCNIRIPEPSVSRKHAVIEQESGNNFYLKDTSSRNGSKVNGRQLTNFERCLLKDGDLIQFGLIKVEFFVTNYQGSTLVKSPVTLVQNDDNELILNPWD